MSEPLEIPKESEEATDSKKIIEDSRLEKLVQKSISSRNRHVTNTSLLSVN